MSYKFDRKWSYAFQLLFQELQGERKRRDQAEKEFAENGGQRWYHIYCSSVARIEDLEAAIIQLGGKP